MKPYKISIKLTSHGLDDDVHIKTALNKLFSHPASVRICIQRLKTDYIFPIQYRLTVWYYLRGDWTPEMWMAEHLKMGEIESEVEK